MYLGHWSLRMLPFENIPDSRFFFPTPAHQRALAALTYAVHEVREPVLLAGPPGCGKTLLLRALRRRLPRDRYRIAFVPNVDHPGVGLMERIAHHLGDEHDGSTLQAAGDGRASRAACSIVRHIRDAEAAAQTVVAMLDDWPCDTASAELLREMRGLLATDGDNARVCAIVSGAQFELARNWPTALQQRLLTVIRVGPFLEEQVPGYLAHRLTSAGGAGDAFSDEAATAIARWSRGVPRHINRIAHLSLHMAYLELRRKVQAADVIAAQNRLLPCDAETARSACSEPAEAA